MTAVPSSLRVREPLRRTLVRNLAIAGGVGAVFALRSHDPARVLPTAILALWFSLGGHYVEVAFLDRVRPRLPPDRRARFAARLVVWFAGGTVLYLLMAATARVLTSPPPRAAWWLGGLAFVGVELVVHALLALFALPNVYDGRG